LWCTYTERDNHTNTHTSLAWCNVCVCVCVVVSFCVSTSQCCHGIGQSLQHFLIAGTMPWTPPCILVCLRACGAWVFLFVCECGLLGCVCLCVRNDIAGFVLSSQNYATTAPWIWAMIGKTWFIINVSNLQIFYWYPASHESVHANTLIRTQVCTHLNAPARTFAPAHCTNIHTYPCTGHLSHWTVDFRLGGHTTDAGSGGTWRSRLVW